jgi:hypothetical protein
MNKMMRKEEKKGTLKDTKKKLHGKKNKYCQQLINRKMTRLIEISCLK